MGRSLRCRRISKEDLHVIYAGRAVSYRLPLTLIALDGSDLIGTGGIKLTEPGTKPGLSPWLAGMYVKPAFRSSGTGALLVEALESEASALGVGTLYLSVGSAPGFYKRLGWTGLERLTSYGVKDVVLMVKSLDLPSAKMDAHNSSKLQLIHSAS